MPLRRLSWWNEVFHFHLFEFASTKHEVLWSDFVTERLTNLCNTKWWFLSNRCENVSKVCKHSLRSFWTKIRSGAFAFNWTSLSFEHQIECAWLGEFFRPALRTNAVNLVFAPALFTVATVNKWVSKRFEVTRCGPDCRRTENCCVDTNNVITKLHH